MQYFLDTNIYRNLVRNLNMDQVIVLAKKIKATEKKLGISAGFPIVVAMELINHLRPDDPHCDECFKALCLLFEHSKNENKNGNVGGTFFPPLNVVLPKYFFNDNGPFLKAYQVIISLTKDLTENYNIKNILKFKREIDIVSEQLLYEKKEIFDNLTNYLKSINNDILDWEFFKKNERERDKWFREMSSGKTFAFLAEGFMQRAYMIVGKKFEKTDENFVLYKNFHDNFFPALAMASIILIQVGHGTIAISNIKDPRWNTVSDISMMVGALYNSDIKEKIFVTEEKKMHEFFKLNKMEKQIINLSEYRKIMGI